MSHPMSQFTDLFCGYLSRLTKIFFQPIYLVKYHHFHLSFSQLSCIFQHLKRNPFHFLLQMHQTIIILLCRLFPYILALFQIISPLEVPQTHLLTPIHSKETRNLSALIRSPTWILIKRFCTARPNLSWRILNCSPRAIALTTLILLFLVIPPFSLVFRSF